MRQYALLLLISVVLGGCAGKAASLPTVAAERKADKVAAPAPAKAAPSAVSTPGLAAGAEGTPGLAGGPRTTTGGSGLITQDGGGLISQDGGGLITQDGASFNGRDSVRAAPKADSFGTGARSAVASDGWHPASAAVDAAATTTPAPAGSSKPS